MYALAIPVILATLAAGYWVLTKAAKETSLKGLGNVLGWIIVVISLILLLVSVYYSLAFTGRGHGMMGGPGSMMGRGMMGQGGGMMMQKCPKCGYDLQKHMMNQKSGSKMMR